jgi:hypothetical protein
MERDYNRAEHQHKTGDTDGPSNHHAHDEHAYSGETSHPTGHESTETGPDGARVAQLGRTELRCELGVIAAQRRLQQIEESLLFIS